MTTWISRSSSNASLTSALPVGVAASPQVSGASDHDGEGSPINAGRVRRVLPTRGLFPARRRGRRQARPRVGRVATLSPEVHRRSDALEWVG